MKKGRKPKTKERGEDEEEQEQEQEEPVMRKTEVHNVEREGGKLVKRKTSTARNRMMNGWFQRDRWGGKQRRVKKERAEESERKGKIRQRKMTVRKRQWKVPSHRSHDGEEEGVVSIEVTSGAD